MAEDPLDAELRSDLYISHFTMEQTNVSMATVEMLEMANLLYRHREELVDHENPKEDPFWHAMMNVMRKRSAADKALGRAAESEEPVEYHEEGHIWLARQHGEWHNMQPSSRFLEFHRGPGNEPVFCSESQAPIPRRLAAKAGQRKPGGEGGSLIKTFQLSEKDDFKGPIIEKADGTREFAFEALENLLQDLAGSNQEESDVKYQIAGHTFLQLRNGFGKIQKVLQQDIKDGNASSRMRSIVTDLEDGKKIIDKLMERAPTDLMKYIDRTVQCRAAHARYLYETHGRNEMILDVRKSYERTLKEHVDALKKVVKNAQNCEFPSRIALAAGQRSEKIAFLRLRRIKQRNRKQKPTPGQKVLDMLGPAEGTETKLQELKESVVPSQTFQLGALESKGVLVRLQDGIDSKTRKQISFNFQAQDEGFDVQIFMKSTLLKEFRITRQQIEELEGVNKTAASSYAGDFLWMNGYRLRRLLCQIYVDNGV